MKNQTIEVLLSLYDKAKSNGFGAYYTISPLAIRFYLSPYKVFDIDDGTALVFNVYSGKMESQSILLTAKKVDEILDEWETLKLDK